MTTDLATANTTNQIRLRRFRANRRGWWSLWLFILFFGLSLFAEVIANDQPLLIRKDGRFFFPLFTEYSETDFGGEFATAADYRDPYLADLIQKNRFYCLAPDSLQLRYYQL